MGKGVEEDVAIGVGIGGNVGVVIGSRCQQWGLNRGKRRAHIGVGKVGGTLRQYVP